MKKIIIISSTIIFVIISTTYYLFNFYKEKPENYSYVMNNNEFSEIKNGDLVLRRGFGFVSDTITRLFKEKYPVSHVGIVTEHEGELLVAHTVSAELSDFDGMQVTPLMRFIDDSHQNSIIVMRYKATEKVRDKIAEIAYRFFTEKVPFDYDFDLNNTQEMYCSEMVREAILEADNKDVFVGRIDKEGKLLRFDSLLNPQLFEEIINHHKNPPLTDPEQIKTVDSGIAIKSQ